MSAKKLVPGIVGPTSRRAFLRYGGGVVGASLLAPYSLRSAIAQVSSGFDFYISLSGNDANPGTLASPWAFSTLLNANQPNYNPTIASNRLKMAGKRVGVLPGIYGLQTLAGVTGLQPPGDWESPQYQVPSGTSGSPTVLQSTTLLGAVLDGQWGTSTSQNPNGVPLLGTSMASSTQYVTIDGFEIRNGSGHLMMIGGESAIVGNRVPGIVVQNCYLHTVLDNSSGGNSAAITIYSSDGPIVRNNHIAGINNTNNRNSGVETWNCAKGIIEYNTIVMSSGGASPIYIKNANQHDMTVRYNYVDVSAAPSLGGSGACAWDLQGTSSNTSSSHHNIILSPGVMWGTNIAGVTNSSTADNRLHYNNTYIGLGACIQDSGNGAFFTGYNNVFARTTNTWQDVDLRTGRIVLQDYNLFKQSPYITIAGVNYNGLAAARAAGYDVHSVVGAPIFMADPPALPAQRYKLASGSPGKGAGSSNGLTSGAAIDMGAWGGTDVNTGNPIAQIGCNFDPRSPLVPMAPRIAVG